MENYLYLRDGRRLCYAEYGEAAGKPIFMFHGNPNPRLLWGVIPGSPFLPGVRLVAPDRPGFGRTGFVGGVTTLDNWPSDVAAPADTPGIDRFAVFTPSGGGPFALSCAWKISDRLTSVGIFAGVGPFIPETDNSIASPIRLMWKKAPELPGLFRLQMKVFARLARGAPRLQVRLVRGEFGDADREVYDRLDLAAALAPNRSKGYRQGGIGTRYDALIPGNWPIPLHEISAKVYLWQGEEDISVPPSMAKYMAEKIPGCEAEFIPGAGHFWIFDHLTEMLEKLAGDLE